MQESCPLRGPSVLSLTLATSKTMSLLSGNRTELPQPNPPPPIVGYVDRSLECRRKLVLPNFDGYSLLPSLFWFASTLSFVTLWPYGFEQEDLFWDFYAPPATSPSHPHAPTPPGGNMAQKDTFRVVTRGVDGTLLIRDYPTCDPIIKTHFQIGTDDCSTCLLYTSPSPRDGLLSRMPSSA